MSTTQKKKKVKAVQQKRKLFRANEPLLSVFMWGVNHTIHELTHVNLPVMLMPDDFKAYTKAKVDNYQFNKENMPSWFKIKEYCPLVFRNLRERFGITDDDYLKSLTKSEPVYTSSPGKSGARFLLSYDKKYIIKTMVSEEVEEIHHILKEYHQYVVECHAQTLLPQYLGLYRVIVADQVTYLVVMKNVFSPHCKMHRKYDLKGSTVDRSASDKEKSKDLPTLKDNDFTNDGVTIDVGPEAKKRFVDILTADVEWLTSLKLMDYSLLVGIHELDHVDEERDGASISSAAASAVASDSADDDDDEASGSEEELDGGGGSGPSQQPSNSAPTPTAEATTTAATSASEASCAAAAAPAEAAAAGRDEQLPSIAGAVAVVPARAKRRVRLDDGDERFAVPSDPDIGGRHEIYYMAIIDILTHYGMKKRTANVAKQVKHGVDAEISTVHPEQYAKRFLEFINRALR